MNIEKSTEILKAFRNYNKFYKEENKDLTITITLEAKESIDKAIERLLTAYEKEKEKNKKLSNSYDKLAKECNEENRRCMLLAVENQDLKEKNKEYENMIINHKKQLKQSGIYGYDYDLKILKEE